MAIFQRTLTAAVAAAALTGVFTASAWAQAEPQLPAAPVTAAAGHPGHAGHPAHRGKPADFAQFHAERNERLKTILQLQPQQEAAWEQYVKATTPAPRAERQAPRADLRTLTTPERLDLAQKMRAERTAKAEQRDKATRTFYRSLNPSQQKAFDALNVHALGKHHTGHGQRMGHPGHRHGPRHPAAPAAPQAPAA